MKRFLLQSATYLSIRSDSCLIYITFNSFTLLIVTKFAYTVNKDHILINNPIIYTAATAIWLIGLMQTNVTSDNLLTTHTGSRDDEKVSKEEMHTTELLENTCVTEYD